MYLCQFSFILFILAVRIVYVKWQRGRDFVPKLALVLLVINICMYPFRVSVNPTSLNPFLHALAAFSHEGIDHLLINMIELFITAICLHDVGASHTSLTGSERCIIIVGFSVMMRALVTSIVADLGTDFFIYKTFPDTVVNHSMRSIWVSMLSMGTTVVAVPVAISNYFLLGALFMCVRGLY